MEYVADKEWGEERYGNFFLQSGLSFKMGAYRRQDEEIDEPEQCTNMGELEYCYQGRSW